MAEIDERLVTAVHNIEIALETIAESARRVRRLGLDEATAAWASKEESLAETLPAAELQAYLCEINHAYSTLLTSMRSLSACTHAMVDIKNIMMDCKLQIENIKP